MLLGAACGTQVLMPDPTLVHSTHSSVLSSWEGQVQFVTTQIILYLLLTFFYQINYSHLLR